MAPEDHFQTDVYLELSDLLKVAKDDEYSWGGKKMGHDMWMHYTKEIVVGDIKLDELEAETAWLRREVASLDASSAENHAQLRHIQVKFKELEWDALLNGIKIRKAIQHTYLLKGDLMSRYVD